MQPEQPTCGHRHRRSFPYLDTLTCALPAGHHGPHLNGDGEEAWIDPYNPPTYPPTFTQADLDAARQAGRAEGLRQAVVAVAEAIGLSNPDDVHPDERLSRFTFGDLRRLVSPWEPAEPAGGAA